MIFLPLDVNHQHLGKLDYFVFVGNVVWEFAEVALRLLSCTVTQAAVKDGSQVRVVGWHVQREETVEPRGRGSPAERRRYNCRFDDS